MNEIIYIEGEIIDILGPVKLPGEFYTISFITVKCIYQKTLKSKPSEAFYCFKCYKDKETKKLSKGLKIKCTIRRESKLWIKDNIIQKKKENHFNGYSNIELGYRPVIFDEYILNSEIICDYPPDLIPENQYDDGLPF